MDRGSLSPHPPHQTTVQPFRHCVPFNVVSRAVWGGAGGGRRGETPVVLATPSLCLKPPPSSAHFKCPHSFGGRRTRCACRLFKSTTIFKKSTPAFILLSQKPSLSSLLYTSSSAAATLASITPANAASTPSGAATVTGRSHSAAAAAASDGMSASTCRPWDRK